MRTSQSVRAQFRLQPRDDARTSLLRQRSFIVKAPKFETPPPISSDSRDDYKAARGRISFVQRKLQSSGGIETLGHELDE